MKSIFKKAGFFLLFSYFFISCSPLPLFYLVSFFGEQFFGISELDVQFNGSGDKMYNYMEWFTHFILSIPICLFLLLTVKKENAIQGMKKVLFVGIRYYLAWTLFGYGFSKVYYTQFSQISLYTLDQKVGMLTPMGLAWTFMGHSRAYTMFSGYLEVIAGTLLLFRRTTLMGAIISCIVMFNVLVMNLCYDIPVKIFSAHLVLWSLLGMFGFDKRLLKFILNRTSEPFEIKPYFKEKGLNIAGYSMKGAFGVVVLFSLYRHSQYIEEASKPLRGIYITKNFILNSKVIDFSDTLHWKKLVVDRKDYAVLSIEGKGNQRLSFKVDTINKLVAVETMSKPLKGGKWNYNLKDSILTLRGNLSTDSFLITLKQFDHNSFRLNNRGFHWVNEFPYNR